MKEYSSVISLTHNNRGVYCIDPIMGCRSGIEADPKGCYGECYAYKIARAYGFNFSKSILRDFIDVEHKNQIMQQIKNAKMPFIRMGCSGDPSEDW